MWSLLLAGGNHLITDAATPRMDGATETWLSKKSRNPPNPNRTRALYNEFCTRFFHLIGWAARRQCSGVACVSLRGGHADSWKAANQQVDGEWDVVFSRLREEAAEHLIKYWTQGLWPKLLVLDGAALCAQLPHDADDCYRFITSHETSKLACEYSQAVARTAIVFLAQPPGGMPGGFLAPARRAGLSVNATHVFRQAGRSKIVANHHKWRPLWNVLPAPAPRPAPGARCTRASHRE